MGRWHTGQKEAVSLPACVTLPQTPGLLESLLTHLENGFRHPQHPHGAQCPMSRINLPNPHLVPATALPPNPLCVPGCVLGTGLREGTLRQALRPAWGKEVRVNVNPHIRAQALWGTKGCPVSWALAGEQDIQEGFPEEAASERGFRVQIKSTGRETERGSKP